MFIDVLIIVTQLFVVIIMAISTILVYQTIKTNKELNQRILFSNITKEERDLRIKFQEYVEKIDNKKLSRKDKENTIFAYETLLFNYYEYVATCLYKKLINEDETKLYFEDLLVSVREMFDKALLFDKKVAKKNEYKGDSVVV